MKKQLEILSTEIKRGTSSKTGKPYELVICQCVVRGEKILTTGEILPDIKVGELLVPSGMTAPLPGSYVGEFQIGVDGRTKQVVAQLIGLVPVSAAESDPFSMATPSPAVSAASAMNGKGASKATAAVA